MKQFFSNRSKDLQDELDAYMKSIIQAGLVYQQGVREYIEGRDREFSSRVEEMIRIKQEADHRLKGVKYTLYAYNLIPDASGDILELTDSMKDLVHAAKDILQHLSIEQPEFPDFSRQPFIELMEVSWQAADELMKGVRSFFENTGMVEEYVTKVYFYENEADKKEDTLARSVFQSEEIQRLSHRIHLRDFIQKVVSLSDIAEGIALKLSVFQLKRKV